MMMLGLMSSDVGLTQLLGTRTLPLYPARVRAGYENVNLLVLQLTPSV